MVKKMAPYFEYPPVFDVEYMVSLNDLMASKLRKFTSQELVDACQSLVDLGGKFPTLNKFESTAVDIRLKRTPVQAWSEAQKVILSFAQNSSHVMDTKNSGYLTCDQIIGWAICDLGEVSDLAVQGQFLEGRRKDFLVHYEKRKLEHFRGTSDDTILPRIGNRACTVPGSSDLLCLPEPEIPKKTSRSNHSPLQKNGLKFTKSQQTEAPKERLTFIDRLNSMSKNCTGTYGNLCVQQIKSLKECHTRNWKLATLTLSHESRGWFHSRENSYVMFGDQQDPLTDSPIQSFVLE